MADLRQKIEDRSALIAVIGLGYVGLPVGVVFAEAGYPVLGIDVSAEKVESIKSGRSYVQDVPTEVLEPLVKEGRIEATTDFDRLSEADAISICVPTPLNKTKDPDLSYVVTATKDITAHLRSQQLVILESTTYPGTTQELVLPILEESGLEVGKDFFVAFSPERVDPGNPHYGVKNTPKVVGGVTERCTELAALLYEAALDVVVPVSSASAAETVKLLENTFRSVNIGLVNEIAIMCDRLKIDVWEVIDAAATKPFGFMPFYPGPGLGGHCIPIDPHYLSWKLKTLNYKARFIELAGEVNSEMPDYVMTKIVNGLNDHKKPVNGSRILVIGVAYKPDIDDVRESPALDILKLLKLRGADVSYHDPFVPELRLNGETLRSAPLEDGGYDCAVITSDHSSLDYEQITRSFPLVVDTRNATKGIRSENVVKL
ncbi:MAG: nucleotide sugar dehydrogenase [Planctomycetota bacterium]